MLYLKNWKLSYEQHKELLCTAPCTMYGVLFEHGIINDPFYGLNEQELTALSEKGCLFAGEFEVDDKIISKKYVELTFFGVDTICSISLNGTILANVKNMHRTYTYDVKDLLKVGKNRVELSFSSPVEYFKMMNNKHYLYTNPETVPGAAHLRKALYMSGWDWGPTLPDMGIFRPVVLDAYDADKLTNVLVRQHHQNGQVTLDIKCETAHMKGYDVCAHIGGQTVLLQGGKGKVVIENPKLWWVRGYGEQNLYDLTVELLENDQVIDKKTQRIGLRTLTVSTEQDATGSEFCFVLNGIKIFSMGANYIPQDNLLARITPQRTEELIKTVIDANFNTLRVWGGGYYPEDEFYDLCDQYGIMVWQDFMTACVHVWLRKEMKEEFIAEAIDNVKRLRNHPSLAILCGNNEMEWQTSERNALVRRDYLELYERIYPDICDEYAPDTFYWPASPSSGGGFDSPNAETRGDVHYWDVWHGDKPFTAYREHKFRFCSEYGFESYPSIKTIRSFCEPKDMNCFSKVMENHQKCIGGNKKILMYLADHYLYPNNFETLVYASQLLQADAIKYGVEHFRRNRGYCMGSIYWQFNDCWPVASWSSVDSHLRYKALHYAAKKFYAPVAMGLFLENGKLTVNISNETMTKFEGTIRVVKSNALLQELESNEEKVHIPPLSSADVFAKTVEFEDVYSQFIYVDLFDKNGQFIMRQTQLAVPPKYFNWVKPEFDVQVTSCDDGVNIAIRSNCFAKGVHIDFNSYDCVLSDNFFDLTDSNYYNLTVKTEYSAEELSESLQIMSVYDIGR